MIRVSGMLGTFATLLLFLAAMTGVKESYAQDQSAPPALGQDPAGAASAQASPESSVPSESLVLESAPAPAAEAAGVAPAPAAASQNPAQPPQPDTQAATEKLNGEEQPGAPVFSDEQYGALVFTYWEHVAIKDAKGARGKVRPPTEEELARDLKERDDGTPKPKPPPEERELRLGGIVYKNSKDWTIWLNEQRVTPDAIPKEVMDLHVTKGYIELKWFDEWSNQIYPVRLRPHQRFNLDVRMFLPG